MALWFPKSEDAAQYYWIKFIKKCEEICDIGPRGRAIRAFQGEPQLEDTKYEENSKSANNEK